jgi:transposase-like protein
MDRGSVAEMKDAAETEGARRATGVSAAAAGVEGPPDPEVVEKAERRRFTVEYRLKILRAADACKAPGEIGALLRREGLYSSLLSCWRRQRDEGALVGLAARKRGPKRKGEDPRFVKLQQENSRLERRLKQAELIISFQKKVHEILGIPLKTLVDDGTEP